MHLEGVLAEIEPCIDVRLLRTPEMTGISSFIVIHVCVMGGDGACGGAITQGGISRGSVCGGDDR